MRTLSAPVVLAFLAVASVTACGGESSSTAPATAPTTPVAPTAPVASTPAPTTPPAPEPPKMSKEERNHKTLMDANAALDAKDFDKHVSFYTPDTVKAVPAPQGWLEVKGREELKKQVTAMGAVASDAKTHQTRHFHKGDVIVAEWVTTATHAETKKPIIFKSAGVFWFDDAGLIKQEHVYVDQATPLIQTGRMPGKARDVTVPTGQMAVVNAKGDEDKLVDTYKATWPTSWPKKDAKAYTASLTEDFVKEAVASPVDLKGPSQALVEMQTLVKAVPDLAVTVDNAWAFDTFVVAETTVKGTQKGMLGPLPGTGKKIAVHGLDIAEMKGDKIARLTTYTNSIELLGQLGLVPAPKAGAAPAAGKDDKKPAGAPKDQKTTPPKK